MHLLKYRSLNNFSGWGLLLVMLAFQSGLVQADTPDSLAYVVPKARVGNPIDDNDRVTIGGHRLAQLDDSEDEGPVDGNLMLKNMILVLNSSPKQQAALEAFSKAQQTPGAPEYHHWLTPKEFADHFGVASQDLDAIKNYLIGEGFSIDGIQAGGRSLTFSGTAAQVRNTFHTEIHHIIWQGEKHIANVSDPQIPVAFSGVVGGIINLHNFHTHAQRPDTKINDTPALVKPLSGSGTNLNDIFPIANFTSGGSHYLTPGDYGVIYDINPLYAASVKGNGINIAVLGRSNIVPGDIASFQSLSGLPLNPAQIIINGTDPGLVSGDQMESSLDVEWAGGIAPEATVKFITSASPVNGDGIVLSAQYAVNNNIGDIISLSYGLCESLMGSVAVNSWSSLWQQAQTQGQTVLVSSGDSGAAGCDVASNATASGGAGVNGLCSSPYSTCVGGTQFNDTSNPSLYWQPNGTVSALSYIPETVWNESGTVVGGSALYASGGGKSIYLAKPSWQVSPGVPTNNKRDVPDISLSASQHDGYITYMNGQQYIVGGTSAAAPALAGIIALLDQYNGYEYSFPPLPNNSRQGNINPTLYGLYQRQASGGSYAYFYPTLSGNNSVPGQTGFSATGAGYNLATGLGSVDANLLVRQWRNLNPGTTSVALSSSSANLVAGQTVTFNATVTGFLPTGSVQFKNNGVVFGTAAISGGVASLATNALITPGANLIVAAYAGDSNNLSSTSAALTETVLAATTLTINASPASITAGQSLTLTATVTGASPTGTVQFYINNVVLGTPVALGSPATLVNGIAVLTTTGVTTIGLDTITAIYSGDSNNAGNTSAPISETVTPAQAQQVPALASWQEILFAIMLFCTLLWIQRNAFLSKND